MTMKYSWSELLLKPVEFDFGPQISNQLAQPTVKYVAAEKFLAPPPLQRPQIQNIFGSLDMSAYLIKFAISSAVFVKQSTIPDRLTSVTESVVEFTSVMDQHYAIKEKVKRAGHMFVDVFVSLFSTIVAALLQAMIAYHNTPGHNQTKQKIVEIDSRVNATIHDDALLVTFCVGGLTFTTQLQHLISRKRTMLGRLVFHRSSVTDTIFIDRDGQHFRHILNHIRGTDTISHIKSISTLDDLLEESKFYELDDLTGLIMEQRVQLLNTAHIKENQYVLP